MKMNPNQTNELKRDETLEEISKLTQCPPPLLPPQDYVYRANECCRKLCDARNERDSGEFSDAEVEEIEAELDEYLRILRGYGKGINVARAFWEKGYPELWEKLGFK